MPYAEPDIWATEARLLDAAIRIDALEWPQRSNLACQLIESADPEGSANVWTTQAAPGLMSSTRMGVQTPGRTSGYLSQASAWSAVNPR